MSITWAELHALTDAEFPPIRDRQVFLPSADLARLRDELRDWYPAEDLDAVCMSYYRRELAPAVARRAEKAGKLAKEYIRLAARCTPTGSAECCASLAGLYAKIACADAWDAICFGLDGYSAFPGLPMIQITNHGPLITATNYFQSELARAGKLWCSVNAGAIRVLLPRAWWGALTDMRAAQYCVLSRGPWPAQSQPEGIEIMWEDGSDSPYALHLTPESFDLLPAEPAPGREWICSTWTEKDGKPHKALERICHWRRADKIPCLRAWGT